MNDYDFDAPENIAERQDISNSLVDIASAVRLDPSDVEAQLSSVRAIETRLTALYSAVGRP